ncbi:winged helix-turn-helix domain-containing protein [Natranaerobius thermophilus]|uniref:Putative transcriptional regulator, ModE family n=1 Tax=Natranaerobius thermophilus (strain ATCC BAA-1301 / DSM 18059 / JW/NM-WN-LF) TaxID=457570 RepID=B2A593_NATTJ|nr:LysR family transcriptional regulator [Natranaerobius thermophilus]ACB83927.1 putative transcriptional regulator, ModE family [Natranaerobius thermophilus JW/NM-WN-LF]
MKIKFKLWVENNDGELIIGEGLLKLLLAIKETGSISKASEKLNMSYRTAWGRLKKVEDRLNCKLIEKKYGGESGGGTTLTEKGDILLKNYDELYHKTENYVQEQFEEFLDSNFFKD